LPELFSSRKNYILAERTQFAFPQRLPAREPLAEMTKKTFRLTFKKNFMIFILFFFLTYFFILYLFPPKKPNIFYGYQLGSAKKSLEHWKLANKYAAKYLLGLYSFLVLLSLTFILLEYDDIILILPLNIIGLIFIYFYVEKKLNSEII
jgi:hypothetical protein